MRKSWDRMSDWHFDRAIVVHSRVKRKKEAISSELVTLGCEGLTTLGCEVVCGAVVE